MFSKAFTLLPDERTSTSIQLAFSGCVLLLCRFVAVRSFFEGAALAKPPSPSLIVAPPLFSRGLWLLLAYSHVYATFWSLPFFVFCFKVQKKKEALHCCRVLTGWFEVITPDSFSLNQCLRRLF